MSNIQKSQENALVVYQPQHFLDFSRLFMHLRDRQTNPWYYYGFALLFSLIGFGLIYVLRIAFDSDRLSLFLLLFPLSAFSSLYGGFRAGVLTTLLLAASVIGLYAYQYHTLETFPMFSTIQIGIFVLEGIFISFLIDKVKRFDIIAKYAARDRQQKKEMAVLTQQLVTAEKNIKARDEFLSFVSHELKTPLTSMLLQSQLALHNIRNVSLANFSIEKLLKMLENSESQTKQLAKMVNDLLNVSLITTGKLELEKEEVDLGDLVNKVISKMEDNAHAQGYDITSDIEDGVVGQWDHGRLEQVVTNLFSNAIKYGKRNPIAIQVYSKNGHAKLVVKDKGIGIPKELKGKLFNRFERGANAHQFEGLGVGLYICYQIVKAHEGSIEVKSAPDKGSTFTISLPLA